MVEPQFSKLDVAGSSPVPRSLAHLAQSVEQLGLKSWSTVDQNFIYIYMICKFCSRECDRRGLKYHESHCKENPDRIFALPKTEAFYEAMKVRRGNVKNQHSYTDWSIVPFERLGFGKRRERLFQESNHSCSQCGYNKTRDNGSSILEIDHIDGDHTNNTRENLRVLCPNCHALTPNFRNWGRTGKKKSSKRIRKGNKEFKSAGVPE